MRVKSVAMGMVLPLAASMAFSTAPTAAAAPTSVSSSESVSVASVDPRPGVRPFVKKRFVDDRRIIRKRFIDRRVIRDRFVDRRVIKRVVPRFCDPRFIDRFDKRFVRCFRFR